MPYGDRIALEVESIVRRLKQRSSDASERKNRVLAIGERGVWGRI